ncbi:conserved protein of unknown function [Pararobbsia alpina]|uniref:hypothetical protein n=1 Tax=Pararobbsia alpina TaxID=621374 RepID=UPI0039A472B4
MSETTEVKKSGPVNVFCKLPHGIKYVLRNGTVVEFTGTYGQDRLSRDFKNGELAGDIVAGFGVTRNIDGAVWAEIVEGHGKSVAHKNGLIFATPAADARSGASQAKEKERERTGFEPIDPTKDPMRDADQGSRAAA